jgi:outer membrane protein assembly factor BamD
MPEAAEAQLKIANIQYQQMEKSDRDYTHAKRAEDEYRNLIMQYPDNPKLVKEGKERLLEVQEVLADREFGIGKFYNMRLSYPASIARLRSLVEKYPLYSRADEALYVLGQDYEGEIAQIRARPVCIAFNTPPGCVGAEVAKSNMIAALTKEAAGAYSQIITRYPVMDRGDDAKKRLAALHQPIPRPTKAAVAQNRAEEESRRESSTLDRVTSLVKKGPDMAQASKVGDPTLVDPTPVSASAVVRTLGQSAFGGERGVNAEVVKGGVPAANEAAPRSDAPPPPANGDPFARPSVANAADPNELKPAATPDANELKPNAPPDPNELTPAADAQSAGAGGQALPPPVQVNEIQQGQASSSSSATASADLASDQDVSSSKKKKKKGLKKVVSF